MPASGVSENHRIVFFPVASVGTCAEQQRGGQEQNGWEKK